MSEPDGRLEFHLHRMWNVSRDRGTELPHSTESGTMPRISGLAIFRLLFLFGVSAAYFMFFA